MKSIGGCVADTLEPLPRNCGERVNLGSIPRVGKFTKCLDAGGSHQATEHCVLVSRDEFSQSKRVWSDARGNMWAIPSLPSLFDVVSSSER